MINEEDPPLRWVLMETSPWGHRMRLPGYHLARWLVEKGHTVAYVSSPVSPWHFLSPGRRKDAQKRWRQEGAIGRWRHERLFTYIPRTYLPIHKQWPFDGNASWNGAELFTRPRAGDILREAGFARADVLVMQNFQLPHLVRQIQPQVFVARVEDDISGFPGMPRVIVRREGEILADADLVTVTAHSLRPHVEQFADPDRVHYMPNGVDHKRFSRPEQILPTRPDDLPKGPVAIYVGALDSWFDEKLLAATALARPQWNFALIGPPRGRFEFLKSCPNVTFLGPKPQEEIPPYLWHSDVGMIPFLRNPLIEKVCPLKLFEYLAAGLPVISSAWNEIESLNSPAELVESSDDFIEALDKVQKSARDSANSLSDWARDFDWDRIFSKFLAQVSDLRRESLAL